MRNTVVIMSMCFLSAGHGKAGDGLTRVPDLGVAQSGKVLAVIDVGSFRVDTGMGPEIIEVIGVDPASRCYRREAAQWAWELFSRNNNVTLIQDTDFAQNARRVAIQSDGRVIDYAIAAIRSGHAAYSRYDAKYREEYGGAESEAMAEHRGLWGKCVSPLRLFRKAATFAGFPAVILYGIAMNETRFNGRPWPWTLNVAGKGYYFEDRLAAWRAAEYLRGRRFDMFDIGIMQVNWHYFGHLFKDSWNALDPETNQRVAAGILAGLYKQTGNLPQAIGRYHSAVPERARDYLRQFARHYAVAKRERWDE